MSIYKELSLENQKKVKELKKNNPSNHRQTTTQSLSNSKIILLLTIDIGEGRNDTITVYEGDKLDELAVNFCDKHNLDEQSYNFVLENLESNINSHASQTLPQKNTHLLQNDSNAYENLNNRNNFIKDLESRVEQKDLIPYKPKKKGHPDSNLGNIYERLHSNHKRERGRIKVEEGHSMDDFNKSKHSLSKNGIEVGKRLYESGVKSIQERNLRFCDGNSKEILESQSYTFTPSINEKSTRIANSRTGDKKLVDHLIQYGKYCNEVKEQMKNIKLSVEQESCTFKPEINPISQIIIEEKSKLMNKVHKNKFEQLYNESNVRNEKKCYLKEFYTNVECPFKPAINQYQNFNGMVNNIPFLERMDKSAQDKLLRIYQNQYENKKVQFDPLTNQQFFSPRIGRPPITRNIENLSIGDYLYRQASILQNKKTELKQNMIRSTMSVALNINETSTLIVDKMKIQKLEEIFTSLDSDGDGLISAGKIDISNLPTELLEILSPLLCEMEELGLELDLETFIEAADKLLKTLSIIERDKLILNQKKQTQCFQPTFQPKINSYSKNLSASRHSQSKDSSVFDALYNDDKVRREKLTLKFIDPEERSLAECTFKPKINQNYKPRNSAYI